MSADNWGLCPQCKANSVADKIKSDAELAASYGSIPADKWLAMKEKAENPAELEETLREDYEFYIDEVGGFSATYSCSCEACGFEYEFKHEEQLKVEDKQ